jgi:ribonuclease BN (tRNA processing enzyme)
VKRFLFSSDIDSVSELKNFIEGVDLLLIECAHIGIEDIIEFVSEYYVPKVILTHISPDRDVNFMLEYARAKFDLNIEVAFDGMKIEI